MKITVGYIFCAVMCCGTMSAQAEFRVWSSKDGASNVEADFIQMSGSKVVLENKDGKRIMVPLNKLCEKDQEFLAGVIPPEFKIEVDRDSSTVKLYDSGYSTKERDKVTVNVKIKKASKAPCSQKFKAYLYLVAESYKGDARLVIDKENVSFSFESKESAVMDASGSVTYWDSYGSGKNGWQYEGYLVVIENEDGQVVATDTNKSAYESKLNVIRKCKVSRADNTYGYADDSVDIFEL